MDGEEDRHIHGSCSWEFVEWVVLLCFLASWSSPIGLISFSFLFLAYRGERER